MNGPRSMIELSRNMDGPTTIEGCLGDKLCDRVGLDDRY